jgi:hypothetical protein
MRELSSAGSEHLPYKQRVTGSNPVVPTFIKAANICGFFYFLITLSAILIFLLEVTVRRGGRTQ